MGENDDLHEILKTLSDELTQVFEKPGITTKYVHAFWQLRIIPDETHEDLLDPAKREGSSGDARRLFSVLYKLAKSHNNYRQWQLSFFNHLLNLLEKGNEDQHVADKIRHGLVQQLGHTRGILPKREPKFPVPETVAVRPAGINSAPAEHHRLDRIPEIGYEATNMPDTAGVGGEWSTPQLVQTNDDPQQVPDHSNIVTGGHPHQPTSNDRSAPPYISTFSQAGYMNHSTAQMHEETQMAVRRTANEVATNSFSSEEIRLRSTTRLSSGEIYFGPELRQLLMERDEHLRKVLEQQQERENQRLVTKTREESSFEIIHSRLQDINSSTREIERVVKNLETNESEHRLRIMNTLGAIEKRVQENSILLRNQQSQPSMILNISFVCVAAGFVLSSCFIFFKWFSK